MYCLCEIPHTNCRPTDDKKDKKEQAELIHTNFVPLLVLFFIGALFKKKMKIKYLSKTVL